MRSTSEDATAELALAPWLQRLGLRADEVNLRQLQQVANRLATERGRTAQDLLSRLDPGSPDWHMVTDAVVVGETWLRRDPGAFDALVARLPRRQDGPTRLLCAPCASGEEALSAALALRDAGWSDDSWTIDALDISRVAVEKASRGHYRAHAFRGLTRHWIERHFQPSVTEASCRQLRAPVAPSSLRFAVADLLTMATPDKRYDAVFCRNLLIYLDDAARQRLVARLRHWCTESGLIFVGHAEAPLLRDMGLQPLDWPMSFGFVNRPHARPAAGASRGVPGRLVPGAGGATPTTARPLTTPARPPVHALAPGVPGVAKANTSDPDEDQGPATAMARAAALADAGKIDRALDEVGRALERWRNDTGLLTLAARLELAQGQPQRCKALLQRALYLAPDHLAALETGLALAAQGASEEERDRWRQRLRRARARSADGLEHQPGEPT